MSAETQSLSHPDTLRDVALWRRKKQSIALLLASTATWVVMEIYEFNFVTVASWVAMFVVSSAFVWGNILRLLNKEAPRMTELEITEQSATETAHGFRWWMEEGVRWMFRVGAEGDVYMFVGTVAALWVASVVGGFFDFLTLLYIGIVGGMTVPVIYFRYEDRIKGLGERIRMQSRKMYNMINNIINDKVIRKLRNKQVVVGDVAEENRKNKEDSKEVNKKTE